jgi:hypothetical protein
VAALERIEIDARSRGFMNPELVLSALSDEDASRVSSLYEQWFEIHSPDPDDPQVLDLAICNEDWPAVKRLLCELWPISKEFLFTEFVYSTTIPALRGDPFGPEHLPGEPGAPRGFGLPSSSCLIGERPGIGAESSDTVVDLAAREDELVIRAHTYDKFYGTPLELALRARGVDRLIVTGVTTDVCVNSTVLSAANRNYRVIAVTDGMATIHDHIHEACLEIWRNKFARLASTDEVLRELRPRTDQGC